ncbi:MAG: GGDEF domain-containing protein [Thermomicrobiales bacterium]|nr:GGDEF domain-containing protein [Thermomicrobiales bacterium]
MLNAHSDTGHKHLNPLLAGVNRRFKLGSNRAEAVIASSLVVYLLFALTWSAVGRRDVDYARVAALACACGAAAALIICIQALIAERMRPRPRNGWIALTIAAALHAGTSIAGLVVVWDDGVIFWRPASLRWFEVAAALAFTIGVLAILDRLPTSSVRSEAIDAAIALIACGTAVYLIALFAIEGEAERLTLAPSLLSIVAGALSIGVAIRSIRFAGHLALGLALAGSGWLASTFLLNLGNWTSSTGATDLGRWLFPIAPIGLAVAFLSPHLAGERLDSASRLLRRFAGLRTLQGSVLTVTCFVGSSIVASLTGAAVALDLWMVSVVVVLLHFARVLLDLRTERHRVATLLDSTEHLERLANIDLLTSLPNRLAVDQRLGEEFERAVRYGHPISICYVDIDHFKSVNDRYGHRTGDVVLQAVAESLDQTARSIDFVGRYGGEEFIVIAPETWSVDALVLGERLRAQVESLRLAGPDAAYLRLTISTGIAGYPEHAETLDQLVERADQALYHSKQAGRNRVTIWSDSDEH